MAHSYYLGRSGSGKSTLLMQHAIDAINAGEGLCFVDPHGDAVDTLLQFIPPRRRQDTILFDPTGDVVSFNPLDGIADIDQTADALLYAFRDIWRFNDVSTPTFDEYVLHALLTLLQTKNPTLLGIVPLLTDEAYRAKLLDQIDDSFLLAFWGQFDAMSAKERRDEIRSTKNKLNTMTIDRRLRRTLGQPRTAFSMADALTGKLLLIRLPQGQLGINKTRLLGMLMLSQLHIATYTRETREPFSVFIDEAHHFQGMALMELLSGARKFGIELHVSHQYLRQLTPAMRDALIGNTTNRYIFRISKADTEWLLEDDRSTKLIGYAYYELPRFMYRNGWNEITVEPLSEAPYPARKTIEASRRQYARPIGKIDLDLERNF